MPDDANALPAYTRLMNNQARSKIKYQLHPFSRKVEKRSNKTSVLLSHLPHFSLFCNLFDTNSRTKPRKTEGVASKNIHT